MSGPNHITRGGNLGVSSEAREYLFEKMGSRCAYCGRTDDLTLDHISPFKSRDDRITKKLGNTYNITVACNDCNNNKGDQDLFDFCNDREALALILGKRLEIYYDRDHPSYRRVTQAAKAREDLNPKNVPWRIQRNPSPPNPPPV